MDDVRPTRRVGAAGEQPVPDATGRSRRPRIDRLLPAHLLRDPRDLRRARLTVATALALAAVLTAVVLVRLGFGPLPPAALALAAVCIAGLAAVPWILRRTGSLELAARSTTGIVVVLLVTQVAWAGGVDAPAAVLLVLIPLLASHLIGARLGRWVVLLVIAAVVAFALAAATGSALPRHPLDGAGESAARGLMLVATIVLVWILSRAYEAQRRVLERRLERSQALYRRLFTQSKDAVALSTPQGELFDVNDAGVELYGFPSREAMLAADTRSFYIDPADREVLVQRLGADGFVTNYETRQRTVDGRPITVQGTTTAVRNSRGEVGYFLTILRDVTRETEAAAALERKNAELERFTSAVSHDLKNPIFTILGFLELAADDVRSGDTDQVLEDLGHIESTVEKMQEMVERMLQLARLGVSEMEHAPQPLGEVAREVEEMLTGQLKRSGVTLSIAEELPTIEGDRALLRMLFQNLVENAVKFLADHADPRVEIGWRPDAARRVIFVRDNGPGIAEADQQRIFGLFTQLDTGFPGTGIGLATVHKVAELHGGDVWVESDGPDAGACFCVAFPRPPGDVEERV